MMKFSVSVHSLLDYTSGHTAVSYILLCRDILADTKRGCLLGSLGSSAAANPSSLLCLAISASACFV